MSKAATSSGLRTPERLRASVILVGAFACILAMGTSLAIGPAGINKTAILRELIDRLPFIEMESGLSPIHKSVIWEVRLPRILLGGLVGGTLAVSGASYQAVFRNPLADPYLLGAAAGAGLGATVAIVTGSGDGIGAFDLVPVLAFLGAMGAVIMRYFPGHSSYARRSPSALLTGVAVAAF